MGTKPASVTDDHALIGTWITQQEDSDAAFTVSVKAGKFHVSGFCRSEGEAFKITQVKWDGTALSLMAQMPSTGHVTRNVFRMRPNGKADLHLTLFEVWKKKDVKPGGTA